MKGIRFQSAERERQLNGPVAHAPGSERPLTLHPSCPGRCASWICDNIEVTRQRLVRDALRCSDFDDVSRFHCLNSYVPTHEKFTLNTVDTAAPPWIWPRAAYIHIPFCAHKCGYCDFASLAGVDHLADRYLDALEREMELFLGTPQPVDTIFVGGGTPTRLDVRGLERLTAMIRRWFVLAPGGEWTIEANPGTLDDAKADLLALDFRDAHPHARSDRGQWSRRFRLRQVDRVALGRSPTLTAVRTRQAGYGQLRPW